MNLDYLMAIADNIDLDSDVDRAPKLDEYKVFHMINEYKDLPESILFDKANDLPFTIEKEEKIDSHWYKELDSKPGNFRAKFC